MHVDFYKHFHRYRIWWFNRRSNDYWLIESPPAFGQQPQPSTSGAQPIRARLGSHEATHQCKLSGGERSLYHHQHPPGSPQPGGSGASPATRGAAASSSSKPAECKDSLLKDIADLQDIPPELHGVSVKDLVKALGEGQVSVLIKIWSLILVKQEWNQLKIIPFLLIYIV